MGVEAPDFNALDTSNGELRSLQASKGEKGTAILFICNHCPYVKHVNKGLLEIANDYQAKGINFIAISSNNVETHPQDGPEFMKEHALEQNYPFPYLYDEDQSIARAYDASCTPDLFLFDENLKAVYHGQLDDSRPGNEIPVTGNDLRHAMDRLLNGEAVIADQKPSIGCSIKWK